MREKCTGCNEEFYGTSVDELKSLALYHHVNSARTWYSESLHETVTSHRCGEFIVFNDQDIDIGTIAFAHGRISEIHIP